MTEQEQALLLTVGRLLRAHLADHMNHPDFSDIHLDYLALNEVLAPFDPSTDRGGDFIAAQPSQDGSSKP